MKRLIITALILVLILSGCGNGNKNLSNNGLEYGKNEGVLSSGVWLSFSEINTMLDSERGFEAELAEVVANCESLEIENIYIHVRSYCDSLFKSDIFPLIEKAQKYEYDIFEYMINAFHQKSIKVHAWINPYRVLTSSSDINALRTDSPVYKWLKDEVLTNDVNVCFANGIYLNPAENGAKELVISGIREIISNYQVDGIHFDDYFYPTTDASFDATSYEAYKAGTKKPLSLEEWRRSNVNALISGCYSAIKYLNKDIIFSISPAASIENNYTQLYADVKTWVKDGYVDAIIPQLYFGFEYPVEEYEFENLLTDWKKLMSCNNGVALIIGLAPYKIGTDTEPDNIEWQRDTDIIARQVRLCREDSRAEGYVLFSYSSVFDKKQLNTDQRTALKEYISQATK